MELKLLLVRIHLTCLRSFNRTLWNWNYRIYRSRSKSSSLLIVPYGIETDLLPQFLILSLLLIVPYGIETLYCTLYAQAYVTFNRTLWNWNILSLRIAECTQTFNRTLWNWNFCGISVLVSHTDLLIVPYGIETEQQQMSIRNTNNF